MKTMLGDIFYWLLSMSIVAAITGLLILPLRRFQKLPRGVAIWLWVIPFLRMTVPVGMGSPYSLMSLLSRFATKTVVVYQTVAGVDVSMMNCVTAADSYFPITYKVNLLEQVFEIAALVWGVVFAAIVLMLCVVYITTTHEMKDAELLKDNVYLSEKITTPAVYGIWKPRIILPASWAERDLEYVLLHENAHICRGDNLWRAAAFFVTAIHWFNPLAWVFLKLFLSDLELSCDERVLTKLEPERRKDYALSLLESKERINVFASAFGGAKIRTRIENVLSFRKMTWLSGAAFAGLVAVISYVLLTNAG